jgi:hypothetical protein
MLCAPCPPPAYQTMWDTNTVEFQAVLDTMRHGIGLQGAVCRRPARDGPCRRVRPVQLHEPRTQPKCVHMRGMQGTWRTLGSISTWHATRPAQPARAIIRVAHSTARARHRISRQWALGRAIGSRARRCAMLLSATPRGSTGVNLAAIIRNGPLCTDAKLCYAMLHRATLRAAHRADRLRRTPCNAGSRPIARPVGPVGWCGASNECAVNSAAHARIAEPSKAERARRYYCSQQCMDLDGVVHTHDFECPILRVGSPPHRPTRQHGRVL